MSTANKLSYLNDTKSLLRFSLNKFGSNILSTDTFRSYDTKLNEIYDKLPKVTQSGAGLTITPVQNGQVDDFKMVGTDLYQNQLPSEYTSVEYLQSDNECYIDTGINADYKLSLKMKMAYLGSGTNFMGAITNTGSSYIRHHFSFNNSNIGFYIGETNTAYDIISVDNNYHNYDIDVYNKKITIDNTNQIISYNNFDLGVNYYLFARNNNNNTNLTYGQYKIAYCKMYYQGNLVRDFAPCYRNSDNVAGLYDFVTNTFFTNQGAGTFTVGNTITLPNPDYPQDIKVVEGRQVITDSGKNTYDEEYELGYYNIPDGTKVYPQDSYGYRSTNLNELKPNTEYKISINGELFENSIRLFYYDENKTFLSTNSTSTGKFITPNNCYYFAWHSSSLRQLFPDGIEKLMFSDTIYSLDYEPYYEPVSYNIDLHGENYFEVLQKYLNASNWETVSYPATPNKSYFMYVEFPKNIVNKLKTNGNISAKMFLKEQGSYYNGEVFAITSEKTGVVDNAYRILQNNGTILNYSKNISEWENIYLCIGYGSGITNSNKQSLINAIFNNYNISIVVGTNIPTTYEEYYNYKLAKMPNTTYKNKIYRNNGNWYYEKNIEKIILDGYVNLFSSKKGNPGNVYAINQISNLKSTSSNDEVVNAISNYFIADAYSNLDNLDNGIVEYHDSHEIRFKFGVNSSITTLKLANEWLQNNNVLLYYALATPVTTQITNATLINQLEAISVHTGTNIFTISNDNNMIPELEITRLKELEKLS